MRKDQNQDLEVVLETTEKIKKRQDHDHEVHREKWAEKIKENPGQDQGVNLRIKMMQGHVMVVHNIITKIPTTVVEIVVMRSNHSVYTNPNRCYWYNLTNHGILFNQPKWLAKDSFMSTPGDKWFYIKIFL